MVNASSEHADEAPQPIETSLHIVVKDSK
jgi:hypothetical protein